MPNRGTNCDHLKKLIREVPDFPKKGILFYDITTLLKDKVGFATLIDALSEHYLNAHVDTVLAIEARGFIFGPALVDDLLATGGTANACAQLAKSLGAVIGGMGFVVELDFLNGRKKFPDTEVFSLLHYDK